MNFDAVAYVNKLLADALSAGASDLYLLPSDTGGALRVKVNGVIRELDRLAPDAGLLVTGRLKVLSDLLTYRTDVAQDGAIRDAALFGNAEFRVAVMPTIHGERITLRILNRRSEDFSLESLSFTPDAQRRLRALLAVESGMIVLTGPTGSGKSSTMYALIRELVLSGREDASGIISIEDPVECVISEITQYSLTRGNAGFGFAAALKAALRQDVKTIVIGEIRDRETLHVALEAAFTGHRVIASYHAGDVGSVYARMLHQNFEPFLLAHAITGVVTQRLVPDGARRKPVAAILQADDAWRDFVAKSPTLQGLDAELKRYPESNLLQLLQAEEIK